MNDVEFWALVAKVDWTESGDDGAACRPVIDDLAGRDISFIEEFAERLAQKLHALDTEAHAREIGSFAYQGPDAHFSVDQFLYARCCVVANGRGFYEAVLKNPQAMPKDMEFEALLYVASKAFERKTGRSFTFTASTSYETFSNEAGWK